MNASSFKGKTEASRQGKTVSVITKTFPFERTRMRHTTVRQKLIEAQHEQRAELQPKFKSLRQQQAEQLQVLHKD